MMFLRSPALIYLVTLHKEPKYITSKIIRLKPPYVLWTTALTGMIKVIAFVIR